MGLSANSLIPRTETEPSNEGSSLRLTINETDTPLNTTIHRPVLLGGREQTKREETGEWRVQAKNGRNKDFMTLAVRFKASLVLRRLNVSTHTQN